MTLFLRHTLALIAAASLCACASTSPTILKNGQQGLNIDCSGQAISWDQCYQQAEVECPAGYQTIDTDGVPRPAADAKLVDADLGNFKTRSLTVVCK